MPQAALMLHPSAAAPSVPQLSTPSPRAQASSPFFKPDPDGEGQSGTLHGSAAVHASACNRYIFAFYCLLVLRE